MYQGENVTALQSQRWLGESLAGLMERKPYQKITIGDLCAEADLSRQTFYNLFGSKEDVLRFHLRRQYEPQFQRLSGQENISAEEIVEAFRRVVEANRALLRRMLENHLEGLLSGEMTRCVSLFANRFVKETRNNELLPYSEVLLSGALGHLLVYWLRQENPVSLPQLTGLITEFLQGTLYDMA